MKIKNVITQSCVGTESEQCSEITVGNTSTIIIGSTDEVVCHDPNAMPNSVSPGAAQCFESHLEPENAYSDNGDELENVHGNATNEIKNVHGNTTNEIRNTPNNVANEIRNTPNNAANEIRNTPSNATNEIKSVIEKILKYMASLTWYKKNGGRLRKEYRLIRTEYEKRIDEIKIVDDLINLESVSSDTMKEILRCLPKILFNTSKSVADRKAASGRANATSSNAAKKDADNKSEGGGLKVGPERKKREYIPGYKTAAYAILRVLHEQDGLHKHYIGLKAVEFTSVSFDATDRISGFGSLKTLIKNDLVYKEVKYYLTDRGKSLCDKIFKDVEIKNQNNDLIELVIDSREKKNNRNKGFFQGYFNSRKIPNTTRYLGLGDFVWIKNEKILNYIVERKGTTDFMSSICDGRYKEQKSRLKRFDGNVFYILEGVKEDPGNKDLCRYCKVEVVMDGFTMIETEDATETGKVLSMIDSKIREGEFAEEMSYGSFLDEGSKTVDGGTILLTALLSVRGLGKDKAIGLCDEYKTIGNFIEEMKTAGFRKRLSEKRIGNKQIGDKMAGKIMALLE